MLAEHRERDDSETKRRKKRFLIGGSVIAVIAIVAVILLVITLKPDPNPNPPVQGYNPYKLDPGTLQNGSNSVSGVLKYAAPSDK